MSFLYLGTKIGPFKAFLTTAVIWCHVSSNAWVCPAITAMLVYVIRKYRQPYCKSSSLHTDCLVAHSLFHYSYAWAQAKGKGGLKVLPFAGVPRSSSPLCFGEQPTLRTQAASLIPAHIWVCTQNKLQVYPESDWTDLIPWHAPQRRYFMQVKLLNIGSKCKVDPYPASQFLQMPIIWCAGPGLHG